MAGIQITGPAGKEWVIQPQPGNLTEVQGGLSTNLGEFAVAYSVSPNTFSMEFQTPIGTSGSVMIPTFGRKVLYSVERLDRNTTVWDGNRWTDALFVGQGDLEGGSYRVEAVYF